MYLRQIREKVLDETRNDNGHIQGSHQILGQTGPISFGGPAGQIAIMHQEVVEKQKWISENQFLRALNFCMLLPGPEAQQLATYIGWRLHGTWGVIAAGSLFVIPSIFVMLLLSYIPAP